MGAGDPSAEGHLIPEQPLQCALQLCQIQPVEVNRHNLSMGPGGWGTQAVPSRHAAGLLAAHGSAMGFPKHSFHTFPGLDGTFSPFPHWDSLPCR